MPQPYGGAPPAAGAPYVAPRTGTDRSMIAVAVIGLLTVGLILAVLVGSGTLGGASAAAEPVLLEAATLQGPDPFTPPVSSGETSEPSVATGGGLVSAQAPGLYGGTGELGRCDKEQLAGFLQADAAKGAAWSRVRGIEPDQVGTYVSGLTPAVLRADARVTNHGFANGVATPRQSVLQSGTAVLLDGNGEPVVRCKCGNPLTRPARAERETYVGETWTGFDPGKVVRIVQPDEVPSAVPTSPAGSGTPAGEVPGNLVGNGGFETGAYGAPWGTGFHESLGHSGFWGSADASALIDGSAHTGAYALKITNASAGGADEFRTLSQQIAVTRGERYCLTFYAKAESASPGILSIAVNEAWTTRADIGAGTPGYTRYELTFVAEKATVDVRLISENTGVAWIDDIVVVPGACG